MNYIIEILIYMGLAGSIFLFAALAILPAVLVARAQEKRFMLMELDKIIEDSNEKLNNNRRLNNMLTISNERMKAIEDKLSQHHDNLKAECDSLNERINAQDTLYRNMVERRDLLEMINSGYDNIINEKEATIILLNSQIAGRALVECPLLAMPVEDLDISGRALASLWDNGVKCVGDMLGKSDEFFLSMNGICPTTLDRLKQKIQDAGIPVEAEAVFAKGRWFIYLSDGQGSNDEVEVIEVESENVPKEGIVL